MAQAAWENRLIDRSGAEFYMLWSITPCYDEHGELLYIASITQDVTERKQAEEQRDLLQRQVIEAQRQTLAELSTPIIPLMDGIIVMPLVGAIDTMRSKDIMRTLLKGVNDYRARIAIIDITGVPVVDSGVADHLNRTIQAAWLKGAQTIVTGVSDTVAETIVDLGIDWGQPGYPARPAKRSDIGAGAAGHPAEPAENGE